MVNPAGNNGAGAGGEFAGDFALPGGGAADMDGPGRRLGHYKRPVADGALPEAASPALAGDGIDADPEAPDEANVSTLAASPETVGDADLETSAPAPPIAQQSAASGDAVETAFGLPLPPAGGVAPEGDGEVPPDLPLRFISLTVEGSRRRDSLDRQLAQNSPTQSKSPPNSAGQSAAPRADAASHIASQNAAPDEAPNEAAQSSQPRSTTRPTAWQNVAERNDSARRVASQTLTSQSTQEQSAEGQSIAAQDETPYSAPRSLVNRDGSAPSRASVVSSDRTIIDGNTARSDAPSLVSYLLGDADAGDRLNDTERGALDLLKSTVGDEDIKSIASRSAAGDDGGNLDLLETALRYALRDARSDDGAGTPSTSQPYPPADADANPAHSSEALFSASSSASSSDTSPGSLPPVGSSPASSVEPPPVDAPASLVAPSPGTRPLAVASRAQLIPVQPEHPHLAPAQPEHALQTPVPLRSNEQPATFLRSSEQPAPPPRLHDTRTDVAPPRAQPKTYTQTSAQNLSAAPSTPAPAESSPSAGAVLQAGAHAASQASLNQPEAQRSPERFVGELVAALDLRARFEELEDKGGSAVRRAAESVRSFLAGGTAAHISATLAELADDLRSGAFLPTTNLVAQFPLTGRARVASEMMWLMRTLDRLESFAERPAITLRVADDKAQHPDARAGIASARSRPNLPTRAGILEIDSAVRSLFDPGAAAGRARTSAAAPPLYAPDGTRLKPDELLWLGSLGGLLKTPDGEPRHPQNGSPPPGACFDALYSLIGFDGRAPHTPAFLAVQAEINHAKSDSFCGQAPFTDAWARLMIERLKDSADPRNNDLGERLEEALAHDGLTRFVLRGAVEEGAAVAGSFALAPAVPTPRRAAPRLALV